MVTVEPLDDSTIEAAGALVAREQTAARAVRPGLTESFVDADTCAAALRRLCDSGHTGAVATAGGRAVAVLAVVVREIPSIGRYARLPAEGCAVDPALADPTPPLATLFGELATPLVRAGVSRYYLLHADTPPVSEAVSNIGFGRDGCYAVRSVEPSPSGVGSSSVGSAGVSVRVAGPADLETVARLALVEIRQRAAPPAFGDPADPPLPDLIEQHRVLRSDGAVHLLARVDGADVGLLTIEPTSPVPRLCPAGQPYIGSTATAPEARRRGVGRALVDAAVGWGRAHGHQCISVDFNTSNPLSRPFWLGAGFRPTGYGMLRVIAPAG